MHYYIKINKHFRIFLWIIIAFIAMTSAYRGIAIGSLPPSSKQGITATWKTDLDEAIGLARTSLKPILVFFTAPSCGECIRLKSFSLANPALQSVILKFERVEIDLSRRPELAMTFQVKKVPALYVIEPDGKIKGQFEGYATAKELRRALEKVYLKDTPLKNIDLIIDALKTGKASLRQWRRAMLVMGDRESRKEIEKIAKNLSPGDRKALLSCISDKLLAVRLGALELLEDHNNNIRGLDPWTNQLSKNQQQTLTEWQKWGGSKSTGTLKQSQITRKKFNRYLQDLIGDDPERSRYALQTLSNGGKNISLWLVEYLSSGPSLNSNDIRLIQEVQYSLVIPDEVNLDPSTTAHRIIWGNQDVQTGTLRQLADCGIQIAAIPADLLKSRDPVIREAAIEVLFSSAGTLALDPVQKHLKNETDPDIIFAALKNLGKIKAQKSQMILESYFNNENEDLVIAAIEGAVELSIGPLDSKILPLLDDPRWRVRVAALDAIQKKGDRDSDTTASFRGKNNSSRRNIAKSVTRCLDDKDPFVRHTAALTLSVLKPSNAEKSLNKAYKKYPDMHGVIISVLIHLGKNIPASYIDNLFDIETDHLLLVLDRLKEISSNSRSLIHKAANSENPDIACTALRIIAGSENRSSSDREILITALKSKSSEKQLTIIQEFDLSSKEKEKLSKIIQNPAPDSKKGKLFLRTTNEDIINTISDIMGNPSVSEMIRSDAMVLLCKYGHRPAFKNAVDQWQIMTPSMRESIIRSFDLYGDEAIPLFKKALLDDNTDVWEAAINLLSDKGSERFVEPFYQQLLMPSNRLKPALIWSEGLNYVCSQHPKRLLPFAEKILANSSSYRSDLVILALTIYSYSGKKEKNVSDSFKFISHENPFIRRAAWIATHAGNENEFKKNLTTLQTDPSKYIRELIPCLLFNYEYRQIELALYFSAEEVFSGYDGIRLNMSDMENYDYESVKKLSDSSVHTLKTMIADDKSQRVKFQCMLTLLSYQIPYDLNKALETGKASADPDFIARSLKNFFSIKQRSLGKNFNILLPLLQTPNGKNYGEYFIEEFTKRWGIKNQTRSEISFTAVPKKTVVESEIASFVDPYSYYERQATERFELIFFTAIGSTQNFITEGLLKVIKYSHPGLKITRYDINTQEGLLYNEALCNKFYVDKNLHTMSPVVFTQSGYLINHEIKLNALRQLIERSSENLESDDWLKITPDELNAAKISIAKRGHTYAWYHMAGSGFIAGMNPGLLATLLFLLSFLLRIKQHGKKLLKAGMVFLTTVPVAVILLWSNARSTIINTSVLNSINTILTIIMALALFSIASRFFLTALNHLRNKNKPPGLPIIMSEKRILMIVMLWAVSVMVLNIISFGDQALLSLSYLIKTNVSFFRSTTLFTLYTIAFLIPASCIIISCAMITENERYLTFIKKNKALWKFLTGCLWLYIFINFFKAVSSTSV